VTLKGALLGAGNVALNAHVPGWLETPEVELVAAADVCRGGRDAFLAAVPGARWYDSADELLHAERLDFVDICTPPFTHAALARRALSLSLNVLCEKPLVTRPDELGPLVELSRRQDRVLYTVHNWVFAPILERLVEMVRAGAVGRVRTVSWRTLRSQPAAAARDDGGNWRTSPELAGGGILVDHGWHAFYVLLALVGEEPEAVRAELSNQRDPEAPIEDTADAEIGFRSATAHVFLTWAAEERRNVVEVQGTEGALLLDGDVLELARVAEARTERFTFSQSLAQGSHHPEWFGGVARGFLREVADPARRGANLFDASLCVSLLAAAKESSLRGGEWLPLPRLT
jgi:predicted dehydrogenase